MNKGKRIGLIIGTAILSIILVVVFSTVAVRSTTVKKSVDLGNKYLAEGNYEEDIIAFEKAIKIDSKNTDIKETLDVLYIYEEVVELIAEGEIDKAQEKLEEIKDMPKFDIIKEYVNEIEEELEVNLNGLGNSIQNIISGGRVAYDKEYVYYTEGNIMGNNLNGIYRKNIENDEITVVSNDRGSYINIYDDYLYYTTSDFGLSTEFEVIRIKKDGTNRDVIASVQDNVGSDFIQIIDNKLYYVVNLDGDNEYSTTMALMSMDLDTLEKEEVLQTQKNIGSLLLLKNPDNTIDLYINNYNLYLQVIKDIENSNKEVDYVDINKKIKSVLGSDKEGIYFISGAIYNDTTYENTETIYFKAYDSDNYQTKYTYLKSVSSISGTGGFILGDSYIYFRDLDESVSYGGFGDRGDDKINKVSLDNKKESKVKDVSIRRQVAQIDYYYDNLYEVKGYLAYYDGNYEFIIDKDIEIRKLKSSNSELEEDKELENKGEEEKDIVLEISDNEFSKLNQIMTETLFDGYDRENPDMDKIIYRAFKRANDSNYTYTDLDGYIFGIKSKEVVDSTIKSLFNLKIDSTTLTDDLSDLKEDLYKVGFVNDKYYKIEATSFDKFHQVRIANSIIKKNDGTYYIEFTEYEADRPDKVNWFFTEELDRDFINREEYLIVTGSGFAEIKEEVVNGEEIRYFTKFKMN